MNISSKMKYATIWSVISEVIAKLIAPISAMFLARLLTPEAYGVVATITMITSFAEIFADAGFQKYMVQYEFESNDEKNTCANVAFWTNIIISLTIWSIIIVFRHPLAELVGSEGLGNTLAVAGVSIPLVSISSLQMSLFRREFDYKTLFQIRLFTLSVPFIITIPIAYFTHSYWALIIGTISINLVNALLLSFKSKWKPKFTFDTSWFIKMFSFSVWTLVEQISIWCSGNIDVFIVGSALSSFYLGLYKTAMTTSSTLLALITGATTSILFSALSRLQNDREEFNKVFLKFQRNVSIIVIPLGVGIYIYRELVTLILLGEQWLEIADFLGLYSLFGAFSTVLSHYCSEIYRSLGKPKLSFIVQMIYIFGLIPIVSWGAKQPFEVLTLTRSFLRLYMVVIHSVFIWFVLRLSMFDFLKNITPSIICALLMGVFGIFINSLINAIWWNFICVLLCILFYFGILFLFYPQIREDCISILKKRSK